MSTSRWTAYATLLASIAHGFAWHSQTTVDVAILGGGASGMYAAVRLFDSDKKVVVIEPRDRAGGHVDTYINPATSQPVDVGVLYYHNISVVTDFAASVGVPLEAVPLLSSERRTLIDFTSAQVLPETAIDALGNRIEAFTRYYQLLSQYDYLKSGFHLPSPVPEDLTMSWSKLIDKYNLTGLAFTVDAFNQGWVDILNMPALYVLKGFGQLLLDSFISGYEVRTSRRNNQELFDAAVSKLGPDAVLTSSTARWIRRTKDGVVLSVKTPHGKQIIRAKKLLITAPPLLSNLKRIMRLDEEELDIFGQFQCGHYWNGIVAGSGIPDDLSLYGVGVDKPYYVPEQPGVLTFIPSGESGLQRVYYGSPTSMTDEDVSKEILAALGKAGSKLNIDSRNATVPFIRSHSPYHCTVSAEQIKAGFYDRLQDLQGKQSTFYTGATFQAHDSGSIWLYTEKEIMPLLLA